MRIVVRMQDYPAAHSMDSTWFAVDAAGHVAAFETGENGHMPIGVREPQEYLYDLEAARRGTAESEDDEYRPTEQRAEQFGIFLYGFTEDSEPAGLYQRLVAPPRPVHVDQLPPEIRMGCKKLTIPGVEFTDTEVVQPLEFFDCTFWWDQEVAYIAPDGVTVRPIRGKEDKFAEFVRRLRTQWPDRAARFRFEGIDDGT